MMRRVLCGFLTMLAVLALSVPLYAAETISHQGRLLGADDQPVADGSYGATFSLWDDPVAGTQVWSELRDIQTKKGLFSVELGQVSSFFDIFTEFADRDLYLQVEVQISGGTQTLAPRLRIGTVPAAQTSRVIHGIHAGPNRSSSCLVIATDSGAVSYLDQDSDGDGVAERSVTEDCDDTDASVSLSSRSPGSGGGAGGSLHLSASDLRASSSMAVDLDGDGVLDRGIDQDCDDGSASLHVMRSPPNLGSSGQDGVSLVVDDASSSSFVAHDLDQDGIPDVVVSSVCDASSAKHAIFTKGTGAQAGKSASLTSTATPGGVSSVCSLDRDGNGIVDVQVGEVCDDASVSESMSFFDVFTEMTIDDDCDGISARRRLSSSNIGSSGQDGVEISMACSPDSAVESSFVRRNGAIVSGDFSRHTPFHNSRSSSFFDIFTEMSIDQDCDVTGSRLAIKTKGTGAQRSVACSTDATTSSVVASGDLDGDGLDDSEAALRISPTKSGLAIKTKGTSAQRLRAGTDCDDADASSYLDCDDDGDGIAESSISSISNSDGASLSVNNINGGMPNRISMNLTVSKQTQGATFGEKCFVDGDDIPESEVSHSVTPTTSSVAIKTKGTGADRDRVVRSTCDDVSASHSVSFFDVFTEMSIDDDCDATGARQVLASRSGGSTTGTIRMSATPDSTVFDLGYHGSTTGTIRLMASSSGSDNPIEHSSGAHLTPGGVWTNASDENLKENFQPVDGEEILDKIDQLEISQWNYKNESDEVTHIGPTAQDFKATFGVGENDKSISTIDPSGIALVAVKELRKENQELKAQVAELKKMVEELARKK